MALLQYPSLILWLWCVALWSSLGRKGAIAAPPTDLKPNVVYYNTRNTVQGSIFMKNLNVVLDYLAKNTPETNSASYTFGSYPDIVYGSSECYNMTQNGCSECLQIVLRHFQTYCPLAVGAQEYVNGTAYRCYVRYENYNFLVPPPRDSSPATPAPPDIKPNVIYYNTRNTTQGSVFLKNLNDVLGYLAKNTPETNSSSYTSGSYPDMVYGLSQCYNMTQSDCGQCFNIIAQNFNTTCPLAVGAQEYVNSNVYRCYLRYENYNFF